MTAQAKERSSRFPLIIGVAAAAGGMWLLLNAIGVDIPAFRRIWPILFVFAGLATAADFLFLQKRASSAGWSILWIGVGVLAFALTLGYTGLRNVLDWLPSFPVILGLAFLTTWLADHRKSGNLAISGSFLVVLGVLGFGARYDWLKEILPSAQLVWAILLVVGGDFLVWRAVGRARS